MPPVGGWPSGVYRFRNRINGKLYVGSSKDMRARRGQHLKDLENQAHCNTHLQRAWNKYGPKAFIFGVIERCHPDLLIEREQYWLDFYRASEREFGYNISSIAGKNSFPPETRKKLSESCKGRVISAEARAKINKAGLGRTHVVSNETRAKLSEIARSRPPMSEKTRKKLSLKHRGINSEETRAKISRALMGHEVSDEVRGRISEANKGKTHTEEHRRKNAEFQKRRYESSEEREKTSRATSAAIMASAEKRANRARAGKLSWIYRRLRKLKEQG